MNTTIINGIEIKNMGDGTVEVYADRPSMVRITDLVEVLTSLSETSEEVPACDHFPQLPDSQNEELDRRSALELSPSHPREL
jgi:acylphosphatase